MIHTWRFVFLYFFLFATLSVATAQEAPNAKSESAPAGTNVPGAEYPRILPDLRVIFRIKAPDAHKVEFAFYNPKRYPATKDDAGFWTATTDPVVPGFHYYRVFIDGAEVNDPASETDHEWLTWRRSLHKFAPLLFQTQGDAVVRTQTPNGAEGRPTAPNAGGGRRPGGGGHITLNPDDVQAYPEPLESINADRAEIPHGKLEMVEYDSKSVGTRRKMQVYTPPGYTPDKKYPVLYLLHGIGGDETEWQRFAKPNLLLDNLLAEGKAVPMILVMPNGRAQKNDRAEGNVYAAAPAFAAFEQDLLNDVIPTIQMRYSVLADSGHRGLAGLSMGGGQSLNFGLAHLDMFAWVGGFSSAPNTKPPDQLVADPAAARGKLKLLWLSVGNKDGLIGISQGVHAYLKKESIPHVWNVDGHAHDPTEWRNNLYYFMQKVFR